MDVGYGADGFHNSCLASGLYSDVISHYYLALSLERWPFTTYICCEKLFSYKTFYAHTKNGAIRVSWGVTMKIGSLNGGKVAYISKL